MNRASSRSHSVFTCIIESKVSKIYDNFFPSFPSIVLHSIFQIIYFDNSNCFFNYQWDSQGVSHHRFARLNLVDLAGSERQVIAKKNVSYHQVELKTCTYKLQLNSRLLSICFDHRQKSSGAEGERLKEATNINKSLSTLGCVSSIIMTG